MIYYLCKDGTFTDSEKIREAYYLVTGRRSGEGYDKDFWRFREKLFGKSIVKTVNPTIKDFCEHGSRVEAIKMYHKNNNCTFREACDAIDDLCKENGYYPYNFGK